jgi:mono/diheme cytochrome c family protein
MRTLSHCRRSRPLRAISVSIALGPVLVGALAVLPFSRVAAAQDRDLEIWNGVYTNVQARRGESAFESHCVNCHGADLTGAGRPGRALRGDQFWATWNASSLNSLYTKIQSTMPRNEPSSLPDNVYLDLVAFILEANAFPAGVNELQLNRGVLDTVKIVKKDAADEVPNFARVAVVGCLTQGPNGTWLLTNATVPAGTRGETLSADELKAAESTSLGSATMRLLDVVNFKPELHRGHKMGAKGLVNRTASETVLDLATLQMVGASCPN